NLAANLLLLAASLVVSGAASGQRLGSQGAPFAWLVLGAIGVWTIAAAALRHYDPTAAEREPAEDAALVSVLVLFASTVLAAASLLLPRGTVPAMSTFLLLDWPAALLLRAAFRAAAAHEDQPLDDV